MRSFLTSFCLSAFLIPFSGTQTSAATVSGVIVDQDARPIPRALVTATDSSGQELARTFTALDGSFVLETAEGRGCFLAAELTGFLPVHTDCGRGRPLRVVLVVAPLEEVIIVSATRGEAPAGQVASSNTVFTARDIERRQRPLLSQLLRSAAGVTVMGSGAPGGVTSLFLRGGESTYTKVLLDGIPLNEPGGTFDLSNVTTAHLGRVELVRGAHSALFGSDAVAGVVHMFTRRARPGDPLAEATFEAGSFGTVTGTATFGRATQKWDYSLHASGLSTDNDAANNEFSNRTFSASGGGELDARTTLRVIARAESGRAGVPGQTAFGRPDLDAFYKRAYGATGVAVTQQLSTTFRQTASYSYSVTNATSTNLELDPPYTPRFGGRDGAFPLFDFAYDSYNRLRRHHAVYQADWRLTREGGAAGEHLFTAAAEWDGERATLEDRLAETMTRASRNNVGATLQHQILWPRVFVTGGVRFEHNDSFGFAAVPRASVTVIARQAGGRLAATKLKATAGAGVKEPTILQSFSTSPFFLGNPDLEPERSRTFDVGIEQKVADGAATIAVTWFANRFRNIVSTRTLSLNPFRSQFFNIGLTRARGVEVTGELGRMAAVGMRLGYTFLASEILASASPEDVVFGEGRALFRRPRHSGFVDFETDQGPLTLALIGTFVGRSVDSDFSSFDPPITLNEGHTRWDVRASYQLSTRFRLLAAMDNLFDRRYMEPLGYPALGRAGRAGIHASF